MQLCGFLKKDMRMPGHSLSRWRLIAVFIVGAMAVSSASIFTRAAQDEHAASLVISAWRLTLSAIVLTPIVLTRHRAELARLTRMQIGLAIASGIMLALHFASWITSLEYTSVITSVVLVTSNPIWVALMTPFFLREKLSSSMIGTVIIATIGGVIVSVAGNAGAAPHQDAPLFGAFLAVVGAICVASYFVIGRRLRASVSVMTYIWMTYSAGAIVLCAVVLLGRLPVSGLSSDAYLWMTFLALVPQLLGHSSYNYLLGFLSATYVSLLVLIEPIGSTILAALIFKEYPVPLQLVGGALILGALIYAGRVESAQQATETQLEATP
jgi:drug/metabolite transporter (DMT)-like permease